jgi:hypothetical protein
MSNEEKKIQEDGFIKLAKLTDRNLLGIVVMAISITGSIVWQGGKIISKLETASNDISVMKPLITDLQQKQQVMQMTITILQKQVDDIKFREDKFYSNK